jgi:hypothetical protein
LLEICMLKTLDERQHVVQTMRLFPPRLMRDRSGWAIFASSLECPTIADDHVVDGNIKIEINLQDGLHINGQLRKRTAWTAITGDIAFEADEDAADGRHKTWVLGWRCVLHILQSAVKWSVAPLVSQQIAHDTHCCIRVLRSSSGAIYDRVDEFIHQRVLYDTSASDLNIMADWWVLVGINEQAWLERILYVNPRWDPAGEFLRVSAQLRDEDDMGRAKIKAVVMYCYRWRFVSDTMWAAMEESAQLYYRSKMLGVDFIAKQIAQDDDRTADMEYIGGYRRFLTVEVEKLLAVSVLCLRPLQHAIKTLMQDDRFLILAEGLYDDMMNTAGCVGLARQSLGHLRYLGYLGCVV